MVSEEKFQERVQAWLADGFQLVEEEPTLDSGRRPDFIAHNPFNSYVIEVENSKESLYNGIGQGIVYARETAFDPVVVFPAEEVDEDTLPLLEAGGGVLRLVTV